MPWLAASDSRRISARLRTGRGTLNSLTRRASPCETVQESVKRASRLARGCSRISLRCTLAVLLLVLGLVLLRPAPPFFKRSSLNSHLQHAYGDGGVLPPSVPYNVIRGSQRLPASPFAHAAPTVQAAPTPKSQGHEPEHIFHVGQYVTWNNEDDDVRPGDIGRVQGHEADGRALAIVRFRNGVWTFAEKDLTHALLDWEDGARRTHALLDSSEPSRCTKTHVLFGENEKEPDVHCCLDSVPTVGCIVYSIGIAHNWIFDDFMIEQGCQVFSFDPSMTGVKKHKRHANHLFEPIGIGVLTGTHMGESTLYGKKTNYEVETLGHIMERHGHTHLTMVRMDVESSEWDVLEQWVAKGWMEHMDQLLMEIHMWKNATVEERHSQSNSLSPKDEERHSQILHSIPMELFHTAQNRWDEAQLHGDMTRVHEMGWIKPRSKRGPPASTGCTCVGKNNTGGEGATCKVYSKYGDEWMNGVWCYADIKTCADARAHRHPGSVPAGAGPSRAACASTSDAPDSGAPAALKMLLRRSRADGQGYEKRHTPSVSTAAVGGHPPAHPRRVLLLCALAWPARTDDKDSRQCYLPA